MLDDLVIDTNVLMHAENPNEPRRQAAVSLLTALLAAETALAVDDGFSLVEADNRSTIGSEYLKRLDPLSLGFRAVAQLAIDGRLRLVSRSVPQATARAINQRLRNKVDRTFLRVAVNSSEKMLCSHDFIDFSEAKRADIRRHVGVDVRDAAQVCPEL